MKKGKKRSLKFNNFIHACFSDISETMAKHGINKRIVLDVRPTKENLKVYFVEKFNNGKRTSESTDKELSENFGLFLDSFEEFLREQGVKKIQRPTQQEIDSYLQN